jgi:hypothetical protein
MSCVLVISGSFRWVDGELPFFLHQLIPLARSCKSEDDCHGIGHCYGDGKGPGRRQSNSSNATSNFHQSSYWFGSAADPASLSSPYPAGAASAVLGNLAGVGSPNAIAGAVTGIGFIGGGIVVRRTVRTGEIISGITTAASIFATAAIGAAAGAGLLAVAAATIAPDDGTTGAIAFPICGRPEWT